MRASLRWALAASKGVDALRLASTLRYFWEQRGHLTEGRDWLERALSQTEGELSHSRADALRQLALLMRIQGDYTLAHSKLIKSRLMYEDLEDPKNLAECCRH